MRPKHSSKIPLPNWLVNRRPQILTKVKADAKRPREQLCRIGATHEPEPIRRIESDYGLNSGITRRMNSSNNGTVKAISPYAGL